MAGAALAARTDDRRLPLLAAVLSGMAGAALRAGPTGGTTAGATRFPAGFAAGEAVLFLAAAGLALTAAVRAAGRPTLPSRLSAVLLGGGGIWTALAAIPIARAAEVLALLSSLAVVGGLCALAGLVGGRFPLRVLRLSVAPGSQRALVALGAGVVLTAAGPRAGLVMAGAVLAAAGGYLAVNRPEDRRLPVAPLLTLGLLPSWWLMSVVAGPAGLPVGGLTELPWSPAAERWLAPAFLLAAWGLAGLWPFQRQEPAALTAPGAALLLVQVGLPVAPDGVTEWRSVAMPVLVLGLWHAAMTGRRDGAAAALALIALLAIEPVGRLGAALLLVGSIAMELSGSGRTGTGSAADRGSLAWLDGIWLLGALAAGLGASLAVEAALHAEVVYTVAAAAALAAAAARVPYARMASARREGVASA